jgi:hypothetical protein
VLLKQKCVVYVSLGPGGVADQELWEIRWAKPIGPIKQAERQRCINEAILQTKNKKFNKMSKNRHSKCTIQENNLEHIEESIDMQYVTLLTDYVFKTLQAMCSFECLTSYNPVGFVHKVCIQ